MNVVRTNTTRIALVLLASASTIMLSEVALATDSVVTFKAQDLSSTAGVAALYGRINRAANEVCGAWDSFGRFLSPSIQTCITDAVSHAVAQVNSPMLTRFYNAKTGKTEANLARAR
jgi:UrcA family protein